MWLRRLSLLLLPPLMPHMGTIPQHHTAHTQQPAALALLYLPILPFSHVAMPTIVQACTLATMAVSCVLLSLAHQLFVAEALATFHRSTAAVQITL